MEKDEKGYPIGKIEHSDLIHRQIAYSEIYLKNRSKYPKPFGYYVVHHIDTNKENFRVDNLYLCSKEEHNAIHDEQKKRLRKFSNSSEIDNFLNNWRGQTSLPNLDREKIKWKRVGKYLEISKVNNENFNKDYSWKKHLKKLQGVEEKKAKERGFSYSNSEHSSEKFKNKIPFLEITFLIIFAIIIHFAFGFNSLEGVITLLIILGFIIRFIWNNFLRNYSRWLIVILIVCAILLWKVYLYLVNL